MSGAKALVLSAPASGCGKTTLTLGLLRHLRKIGCPAASAKAGPDYIDPPFHEAASGRECVTLDPWAMTQTRICALAAQAAGKDGLLLVEGAMGLFDGAPSGGNPPRGSTAELACRLNAPVILIVDAARQGQSVAALAQGFARFSGTVSVAGVILNRVGSSRHAALLGDALKEAGVRCFGAVPRADALRLPSRHLGLVQAQEHGALDAIIEEAACLVGAHVDCGALLGQARALPGAKRGRSVLLPPPGRRVAIARDEAFAFAYSHMWEDWRRGGASVAFFSPLADEAPDPHCDAVFLPGGYPELHGERLSRATQFRRAMRQAQERGALIYGECGGFMVLGNTITDEGGATHPMLGFLPLHTRFGAGTRVLGYRALAALPDAPWLGGMRLSAHEFHYSAPTSRTRDAAPLFRAHDAAGADLGAIGLRVGRVLGSYAHIIERRLQGAGL